MPHERKRYLTPLVQKALTLSSLVGVLGHRQVGKTTQLQQIVSRYVTLDDEQALARAEGDPRGFLEEHAQLRTGIDECQLAPALFPALKEKVRKDSRPGLYLLSGSIRFSSRQAIRESLTGRIVNFELMPFTIGEIAGEELSSFFPKILASPDLTRFDWPSWTVTELRDRRVRADKYLIQGGLPGICFIREEAFRERKIREQLATILERDVKLVYPTTLSFREILGFVTALAQREGEVLSLSRLQQETGIARSTQRKLLGALEAVFLIRVLNVEGGRRGITVLFEDQAEARILAGKLHTPERAWMGFAYRHLRTQFAYRMGLETRVFQYRARGRGVVPFVFERTKGMVGFIPISGQEPDRAERGSALSFLRAYAGSKVVFLSDAPTVPSEGLDERMGLASILSLV